MKPEQYSQMFEILLLLGWLLLYMFLAVQFILLALEKKVKMSLIPLSIDVRGLLSLLSEEQYPKDYKKARAFLLGAVILLILPLLW
jgi:hypothetical protein